MLIKRDNDMDQELSDVDEFELTKSYMNNNDNYLDKQDKKHINIIDPIERLTNLDKLQNEAVNLNYKDSIPYNKYHQNNNRDNDNDFDNNDIID